MDRREVIRRSRAFLDLYVRGGRAALSGTSAEFFANLPEAQRVRLAGFPGIRRRRPAVLSQPNPLIAPGNDGLVEVEPVALTGSEFSVRPTLAELRVEAVGKVGSISESHVSFEDLVGHWVGAAENGDPPKEGDAFLDLCALETVVVGDGTDIDVTFVWCHDYPASELADMLPGGGSASSRARPLTNFNQPGLCALECMERLEQFLGGEVVQQHGFTHEVLLTRFEELPSAIRDLAGSAL